MECLWKSVRSLHWSFIQNDLEIGAQGWKEVNNSTSAFKFSLKTCSIENTLSPLRKAQVLSKRATCHVGQTKTQMRRARLEFNVFCRKRERIWSYFPHQMQTWIERKTKIHTDTSGVLISNASTDSWSRHKCRWIERKELNISDVKAHSVNLRENDKA